MTEDGKERGEAVKKGEESEEMVASQAPPESHGESPASGRVEARSREEREEREPSDEDLRRLVEESLEKVTVSDIVLYMMNQLASMAYLRLGLPESVNLKYRDFRQARLAIDVLDAMIKAGEGKLDPESLKPFRGTLANLQMNFVQLVKVKGEG
jgi:hypothetical protein